MSFTEKLDSTEVKNQLPFTYKKSLEKATELDATIENLKKLVKIADIVIEQTDASALLINNGIKTDNRVDAAKIKL